MSEWTDIYAVIIALIAGYLCGSVPFGLVLTRLAGHGDIRATGSGNIGATNVLRAGYKGLALATLIADSGKAALVCLLTQALVSPEAGLMAGLAAIAGHCFPLWLKFRGGKAVAASFGFLFAAMWKVGMIAGAVWLLIAFLFRYSSLAALVSMGLLPLWAFLTGEGQAAWISTLCLSLFVLSRHLGNIRRLMQGSETRIGEKPGQPGQDAKETPL